MRDAPRSGSRVREDFGNDNPKTESLDAYVGQRGAEAPKCFILVHTRGSCQACWSGGIYAAATDATTFPAQRMRFLEIFEKAGQARISFRWPDRF